MSDFFTLFSDRIGLVCCAFSAAAALAALFPKKARVWALPGLLAALLVPIRGCSAAKDRIKNAAGAVTAPSQASPMPRCRNMAKRPGISCVITPAIPKPANCCIILTVSDAS